VSRQLVDAIAYMHRAGIVHRDLKVGGQHTDLSWCAHTVLLSLT